MIAFDKCLNHSYPFSPRYQIGDLMPLAKNTPKRTQKLISRPLRCIFCQWDKLLRELVGKDENGSLWMTIARKF
jgi:hypothetical protein